MAILAVSIGVLGSDLANTKAPVQDAFNVILGPIGMYIVLAGTLISMGGINFAEAYYAPRIATSMAEDGMLPSALAKRNRYNAPYVAQIVTAIASVLLAWSGSFTTLAAISAVSRFTQYLPTCLAVIIFRRKWADKERSYTIPGWLHSSNHRHCYIPLDARPSPNKPITLGSRWLYRHSSALHLVLAARKKLV